MWYARRPARAARQIAADAGLAAWAVAWILVGRWVGALVRGLADPVRDLAATGAAAESQMTSAGRSVADLPLVGDRLAGVFAGLAAPGAHAREAATRLAHDIEVVGAVVGVVTAAVPILALLVPWLVVRVGFARRAAATRALLAGGANLDLLALRALARAPLPRLAGVHPDPAAAWRAGDPDVVRALADLELRGVGLRLPGRAGAAGSEGSRG